ncbi:hypothetical protein BZG36_00937 [Bifiguratus adelaidae]|uniref:t-SNARE coiled-coil homology domain-containing protein n=1 Tax=Bifiguratus adelaidae TaxID=1938954 RepID=A0A261Y5X1_9FUNG|nr:hypothetical protein BZG36_00937 [Bifiguratus adelaidae]
MSFNDLEQGFGGSQRGRGGREFGYSRLATGDDDQEYRSALSAISQQIFDVTKNVDSIQRLISQLGTSRDTPDMRNRLHNLTESTHDIVRDTTDAIKRLSTYQTNDANRMRQRKIEQSKLSKDFRKVVGDFQTAQRLSAQKQREYVAKAKAAHDVAEEEHTHEFTPLVDESQRRLQLQVADNEIEYNENLIAEREGEIREIEQGITELNEVFRSLATMVNEQETGIQSIESNVTNMAMNVRSAADELTTASRYQRSARNKMCCVLLLFAIVGSILTLILVAAR